MNGEYFLYISGVVLLVLGGTTYLVAIFYTLIGILFFRISGEKYWEEKATLFGLIALFSLPLGGAGGALLMVRYLYYSSEIFWNNLSILGSTGAYGGISFGIGAYIFFRSSTRID
jgi:hypothetical protein